MEKKKEWSIRKLFSQVVRFPSKIALRLKRVCYKVSLCENCQRQSCKAFIGLSIHAKMIAKSRFSIYFRS